MHHFLRHRRLQLAIILSITPFLWLFTQSTYLGGWTATIANLFGFIGAVLILWQFALGNRFVVKRFSPDRISLVKTHIFLGLYGIVFALAHPLLEFFAYGMSWALFINFDLSTEFYQQVMLGRLAFYLLLIVWITSAFLRRKIHYRPWLYIHYLTYPLLLFIFFHATEIGTAINHYPFIQAYWFFLIFVYWGLVLGRLTAFFNLGKPRYSLTNKQTLANGITRYTFTPAGKHITPQVGQFAYIRPSFFGEAHPFTIMQFDDQTGEITFGIKAVGRFTSQLESLDIGHAIYLDGPYGVFTNPAHNHQPKVIIAGGIGVTPFVELIQRFSGPDTRMFYCNKQLKDAVLRQEFQHELEQNYFDVISREQITGKNIVQGRLTQQTFTKYVDQALLSQANYFICGSPAFMTGIKSLLTELGIDQSRIYSEEFGF